MEQSQRLIELRIDINTADMYWDYDYDIQRGYKYYPRVMDELFDDVCISAWSLTALLKLLPSEFTTENNFGKYKYEIKIRKYKLTDNVDIYQIAYGNYKWHEDGSYSWKDMINTGEKEELLDAAFEMIVWLKENEKLYEKK